MKPLENHKVWTRVQAKIPKRADSKFTANTPSLADQIKVQSRTQSQMVRTEPESQLDTQRVNQASQKKPADETFDTLKQRAVDIYRDTMKLNVKL